jgi:hypothetical protein
MLNQYFSIHFINRQGIRFGAIALALLATTLVGCEYRGPRADAPERNVTAQEVANKTNQLIGRRVTVRNEVIRQIGPSAFTISDDQIFRGENILVINASGTPFVLPPRNIDIQVTGEVRQFDIASVAREFDLNLSPDTYSEYENQPVIIAQSLALAPEPDEITRNPGLFYNQPVAVEAEIEEVFDPVAFTLDDEQLIGGKDLLVLNPVANQSISPGTEVVVTGIVRQFVVSDLEREYELTQDLNLQRTMETKYRNKPVIIANNMFPAFD